MRILFIDSRPLRRAGFELIVGAWAAPHGLELESAPAVPSSEKIRASSYSMVILALAGPSVSNQDAAHDMELIGTTGCPSVVISDEEDSATIAAALKSGICAFLPTRLDPHLATEALNFVLAGGTYYPPSALLDRAEGQDRAGTPRSQGSLTPRQQEVLRVLREGKSNKLIARQLRMRESTVKVHVRQIMRKLGAANRTQAALCQINLQLDGTNTEAGVVRSGMNGVRTAGGVIRSSSTV